jgi:hypothetical protein
MKANVYFHALWFGFIFLALSPPAAADNYTKTPEEEAMCQALIWNRKVERDPNWGHMHHYCDCVRFTNRAYRVMGKSKVDFSYNLDVAMNNCGYVVSHVTPDFDMLPEVHLQMGIIHSLQGLDALAAGEYTKAMNGNHKLVRAYIGMAEFFIKSNDKKQALNTITEGLKSNPDSKALKRMYGELGGKMPYPAPVLPAEDSPRNQPDKAAVTTPPSAAVSPAPATAAGTPADTSVEERTQIGTPTNPWCRFCPDTPPAPPASSPSMPGVVPKGWQ